MVGDELWRSQEALNLRRGLERGRAPLHEVVEDERDEQLRPMLPKKAAGYMGFVDKRTQRREREQPAKADPKAVGR